MAARKKTNPFIARLLRTIKLLYKFYLTTPHWQEVKLRALTRAKRTCQRCGKKGVILDVHHLHYKTLGKERAKDIKVLCRTCHKKVHGKG